VTYADYARRGFAELSIAATLVTGVILIVERVRMPGDDQARRFVPRTEFAALIAIAVMLGIAMTRVLQYEWAYGYTLARLDAQAYMVVLAFAIIVLALEVARRIPPGRFTRYTATAALSVFTVMIYWNSEAWVANRNIDRYLVSGTLDTAYLKTLSRDIVPVLARRTTELHDPERAIVETDLRCRVGWQLQGEHAWFEWNFREARAKQAIQRFPGAPCH
jgi:hypothetical protein